MAPEHLALTTAIQRFVIASETFVIETAGFDAIAFSAASKPRRTSTPSPTSSARPAPPGNDAPESLTTRRSLRAEAAPATSHQPPATSQRRRTEESTDRLASLLVPESSFTHSARAGAPPRAIWSALQNAETSLDLGLMDTVTDPVIKDGRMVSFDWTEVAAGTRHKGTAVARSQRREFEWCSLPRLVGDHRRDHGDTHPGRRRHRHDRDPHCQVTRDARRHVLGTRE